MVGAIGDDANGRFLERWLTDHKVRYLLEIIPSRATSICGVGKFNQERSLITKIDASKYLSEEFLEKNKVHT